MIRTNDKTIKFNSILLGLYLSTNMITKIISNICNFQHNVVLIILLILSISLLFNKFKINATFIFFNLFIMFLFAISMFRIKDYTYTIYYLQTYIAYGLIATYLMSFEVDFKKVTLTINYIFIIYTILLTVIYIPRIKIGGNLDFTMELSYTSMIGISSVIFSMNYSNSKKTMHAYIMDIGLLLINMWYLLFLSNNRGAILSLIILVVFLLLDKIKDSICKIVVMFILIFVSYVANNNLETVLMKIQIFCYTYFDIRINWLERFLRQIKLNDISTGRSILYKDAYNMFIERPVLGNGIGYFELFHNGQYPHNIFLQMFCEHGIIVSLFFIFFIILGTAFIIKCDVQNNDIQFLKLFFVLAIPRLMISNSYWQIHFFWLYIFMSIIILKKTLQHKKFDAV